MDTGKLSWALSTGICLIAVSMAQAQQPPKAVPRPKVAQAPPKSSDPLTLPKADPQQAAGSLATVTEAPLPTQTIHMRLGMSKEIDLSRPFKTIHITSTPDAPAPGHTIVDALVLTDRTLLLNPLAVGSTNVDFFDQGSGRVASVNVVIDTDHPLPPSMRVQMHTKSVVHSSYVYECDPTGCQLHNEKTVAEPAPLPRGYTKQEQDIKQDVTSTNINK
jgi:Flp pilus assembly secretin CpaC